MTNLRLGAVLLPSAYSLLDDLIEWNAARRRGGVGLVAALRRPRVS